VIIGFIVKVGLRRWTSASWVRFITGIGFLGAGVILTRDGIVIGVTSPACIWILAAIGITIGTNHHITGVKLSILAVLVLTGIDTAEKKIKFLRKGLHE
jgi:putative Mg2+ transporter-C (MgtC) family protein